MIACIENKCLMYPICMNKVEIICPELSPLLDIFNKEDTKITWKYLRRVFPNAQYIAALTGHIETSFIIRYTKSSGPMILSVNQGD